jgi:chromate transport protein ChrA
MSALLGFLQGWVPSIVLMITISVIYFATDKSANTFARISSSAHGLLGAILFGCAIYMWRSGRSGDSFAQPYTWLFVLPVISVIASFFLFRGNKWIHLLQIPNLICMLGHCL